MATLTETQDAYDRQHLHVDMLHADVADVIIRLEAERDEARKLAASETHAWGLMKAAWERSEDEMAVPRAALEDIRDYAPMEPMYDFGGKHARDVARAAMAGAAGEGE